MPLEHRLHGLAEFQIQALVGLGDFTETVLRQNQLARGAVLLIDRQHALFDQA